MKHKVSELAGDQLDEAVALVEGWGRMPAPGGWCEPKRIPALIGEWIDCSLFHPKPLPWSTDWQHGGPIIERECITIVASKGVHGEQALEWSASVGPYHHYIDDGLPLDEAGPTPLIAAMRAYVAAKLGEEVELP